MSFQKIVPGTVGASVILFLTAFLAMTPQAWAARYFLSENNQLIKGCSGTIEIKLDTENADVMAGDSTILVNSGEVTINQLTVGPSLPMQTFHQIASGTLKMSAARLPSSGAFNGSGTFGYINFTPSMTAAAGTFAFSDDLTKENNLIDTGIRNVLTAAEGKTYTFKDRYNKEVDGVGFCTPDTAPPAIRFIAPLPDSSGNPADAVMVLILSDNRAGVSMGSLKLIVNGTRYTVDSTQVEASEENGLYRVQVNPDIPFSPGEFVLLNVQVCDKNVPANCAESSSRFQIFSSTLTPPVCGNGSVEPIGGEECDDGNTVSGDGCSRFCIREITTDPFTCRDGVQNQSEQGIDCGGPCSTPCPTCVDGVLNQGEEGVDCGGPCPSCGEAVTSCPVFGDIDMVTLCHRPEEEDKAPVNMVIPATLWPTHEAHGDTLGACPIFDICSEALLLAAPEREAAAIEQAQAVIEERGVVESQKTQITAPAASQVVERIDVCRQNPDYSGADFDNPSSDTDTDGLSDRMECYAQTHPLQADTDDDGCSDFDELNNYFTDPNDPADCRVETEADNFSGALITDPQPGWILGTDQPTISGKVPVNTVLALVIATPSEQPLISATLKNILTLTYLPNNVERDALESALDQFKGQLELVNDFLGRYRSEFDSEAMVEVYQSVPDITLDNLHSSLVQAELKRVEAELTALRVEPIVAAASTEFSDTMVGDFRAGNFEIQSNPLNDRHLYDLVATVYLDDASQLSSEAVRFSVNKTLMVSRPVPTSIGGKSVPGETALDLGNLWITGAHAQNEDGRQEIEITDPRPSVTGITEFGSQVFAIWNSVVLGSSVISDSEQGVFEVRAPRDLETGVPHRVTLYAVKTENGKKIRSANADVYFRIKTPGVGALPVAAAGVGGVGLLAIGFIVRRLLQMRSAIRLVSKK